ncbi:hypothetical protein BN8_02286 [Fibrisoma limi BUZ 3]|uniref:DUF3861 domain-containing protein n=1 Tax=Fibrisoma limi BUZ 3 TaxID=1185876 RepID=I2GH34_9BACT|nr:DUF3861 domain-containing protein [Fibrisoma limi]CCH53209.1 hypothetical protein BN8_02286 [Fibrisoma limi BUZ 3]
MEKKTNTYHLTLTLQQYANGQSEPPRALAFDFTNHDELFDIIDRIRAKDPFGDPSQATEFALGLKLFSEVMIRHRNHPLFEELGPAFGSFMKRLKRM